MFIFVQNVKYGGRDWENFKRSPMRMSDYTSVQIPKVLTDKVKQKMAKQGYRTVSEFVIDAVRRRLDEITDQNL